MDESVDAVEVAILDANNKYAVELRARVAMYRAWPYAGPVPRTEAATLQSAVKARQAAEEHVINLLRPERGT